MRKENYPSKETVNLATSTGSEKSFYSILPLFFLCLVLIGMTVFFSVVWPLLTLNAAREKLQETLKELSGYQEYNEDYGQTEKDYSQYFATYLTEEEAALSGRAQVVGRLDEKAAAYGKVNSIEIQGNTCQVLIEEIPLAAVPRLSEEFQSDPLIVQVTVLSAEVKGDDGDRDKNKMVGAEFIMILAEPDGN